MDKVEVVTKKRWWGNRWWWRKRAPNGEILGHAEGFASHQKAQEAARREAKPRIEQLPVVEVTE